ncbi:HNH endonuclease [Cetobacterium sp.]|uniref:HNH endonuclease n=1 Tax=Cetobacterium sp. TaxID=2071632 RepID=UPI003F30F548
MKEEFKQIKFFPKYFITRNGKIKNSKGRIMKTRISKNGYVELHLKNEEGKTKTMRVHRLVMLTWKFNKNHKILSIDHLDCNKLNNNDDNLEWVTKSENSKRAIRNQLSSIKKTEITKEIIEYVTKNYIPNVRGNCKEIMEKTKIGRTSLKKIIKENKNNLEFKNKEYKYYSGEKINVYNVPDEIKKELIYKHLEFSKNFLFLEKEYGIGRKTIKKIIDGTYKNKACVKLNKKDVEKIRIEIKNNTNKKEIAKLYGVTYETIQNIANGKTWKK